MLGGVPSRSSELLVCSIKVMSIEEVKQPRKKKDTEIAEIDPKLPTTALVNRNKSLSGLLFINI
jgi:hypothetical protein